MKMMFRHAQNFRMMLEEVMTLRANMNEFTLVNVYAPNSVAERIAFFHIDEGVYKCTCFK